LSEKMFVSLEMGEPHEEEKAKNNLKDLENNE
jgi:hypothetical protein